MRLVYIFNRSNNQKFYNLSSPSENWCYCVSFPVLWETRTEEALWYLSCLHRPAFVVCKSLLIAAVWFSAPTRIRNQGAFVSQIGTMEQVRSSLQKENIERRAKVLHTLD